jgi:hypothetical protein
MGWDAFCAGAEEGTARLSSALSPPVEKESARWSFRVQVPQAAACSSRRWKIFFQSRVVFWAEEEAAGHGVEAIRPVGEPELHVAAKASGVEHGIWLGCAHRIS